MIELAHGVTLHAPGALYVSESRALVVADLHAGYVDTLRHRGVALPPLGDEALHRALAASLERLDPLRVVVAGDLVHGAAAAHRRAGGTTALDLLVDVLRGRSVEVVLGNHDRAIAAELTRRGIAMGDEVALGAHRVRHGDERPAVLAELREAAKERNGYLILGHHHPALSVVGRPGVRARLPAFAWCDGLIALPAFSTFARGADLRREDYAEALLEVASADELETAVVIGERVVPTGNLAAVRGDRGEVSSGRRRR